jgi:transitional endoplasmic reticulum ATPase
MVGDFMPEDKEKDNNNGTAKLKVGELTERNDFGRGIVRFSAKDMKSINVSEGDVVELEAKRKTAAIAVRSYPVDVGLDIVRMDGLERRNCGAGIGEVVKVKKSDVKEAKSVVIAPARKGIIIHMGGNLLKQNLLMRPLVTGDIIIPNPVVQDRRSQSTLFEQFFGVDFGDFLFTPFGEEKFVVVSTEPKGVVRVTRTTDVELLPQATKPMEEEKIPEVTYEDLGGLHEEIKKVREMIELPLKHPELFERLGIEPPKGILLHGPPGTGKTLLAKAVANESGARFFVINGPEIMSKFYGESEENLRKIFEQAEKNAPSIIFIDELDAIAPKREEVKGEVEKRVVSQLLTLLDGLKNRGKIVIIGATNIPNAIDPALRRPGRFDREIELGVPNKDGRKEIIQIHTRGMPLQKNVDLTRIAEITYGYVGADLAALSKEAAMHALRRVLPDISAIKEDKPIPQEVLKKLIVTKEDFDHALKMVEPSAMREVMIEIPQVKWDDIGGLEDVKELLRETVEWPLKHQDEFTKLGIKPPTGVLLYGPPGTGKTMLAKAVANESGANFISVKGPELLSMWVGESERHVREVFRKARQVAPCIIFFDEIDSLVPKRGSSNDNNSSERVVSQLLAEISGLEELNGVSVIAATNRPDMIDTALLRPGRFDRQILVHTPDEKARLEIFRVQTKSMPLTDDVDIKLFASRTPGFSGADIEGLVREAALHAMRKNIDADKVTKADFEKAMKDAKPSLTEAMNQFYETVLKKRKSQALEEDITYMG